MRSNTLRVLGTTACLLVLSLSGRAFAAPESGEKQTALESAAGTSPSAAPVSVLQVTGTTNSFTISAQHADVASLLKLVFDQAHRQFVPDGSVTGDVTFSLAGQKFDTVLDAVCRQAFLRYTIDRNNIYQFRRDDEALRNLLLKTRLINSVLRDQLQRMGYNVPAGIGDVKNDQANDANKRGEITGANGLRGQGFAEAGAGRAVGGGFGGGGAGGSLGPGGGGGGFGGKGTLDESNVQSRADLNRARPAPAMKSKTGDGQTGDEAKDAKNPARSRSELKAKANLGAAGPQGEAGPSGPSGPAGVAGNENRAGRMNADQFGTPVPNLDNNDQYQQFLKQNNFVSVNTKGRAMAMRDILSDLSRQSGVPILIDPDVPKGNEFVITSTITARPLREMLNILAYYARLEWRWTNNRIFITTTPQLQVFLRGTPLPIPGSGAGGITILPDKKKE